MDGIYNWLISNKEWFLSGMGIALVGIIWSIVKKLFHSSKTKKGKLKISFTFKQAWEQNIFGHSPVFPLYSFEIINIGDIDVQIKDVQIYFCGRKIDTPYGIADGLTQIDSSNPRKYQVLLSPKQVLKGDFEISSFLPIINNQLPLNTDIRLKVIDTLDNKYFSKKSKYKSFLDNVQISNTVNKKQ